MDKNVFDVVTSYFRENILEIFDLLSNLNLEISNIEEFSKNFLNHNSSYNFSREIYESLSLENDYDKFIEAILVLDRVDYTKLQYEPQIAEILNFFSNVESSLLQLINNKYKLLSDLKKEYLDKKNIYSQYIKLLNGELESDAILRNDFINYLRNSGLDKKYVDYLEKYLLSKKIIHCNDTLVDEKKITQDGTLISLPTLDLEIIEQIDKYKKLFDSLDEKEKNGIKSANDLLLEGSDNYLENIVHGFSANEVKYYCAINTLLNLYNSYKELFNEKNLQEAYSNNDSFEILKMYIEDITENIKSSLQRISEIEEKNLENNDEIELDNYNIVLFLDDDIVAKNGEGYDCSVCDIDIAEIQKKAGGEAEKIIRQVIRLINTRFNGMSSDKFRGLGSHLNKPLSNGYNSHYNEFDVFNVRVAKGGYNNPVRIPYVTISLSENNRKVLCEKYNLPKDASVYLILGIFMKKNDDSEYVRLTHNRLVRRHMDIDNLNNLFGQDFNDITTLKVQKLIDKNFNTMEELNASYKKTNVK